jgi:sortase A
MYRGIIYDSAWGKTSGETAITIKHTSFPFKIPCLPPLPKTAWRLPSSPHLLQSIIYGIGIGLVLVSITAMAFLVYPVISAEIGYRITQLLRVFADENTNIQPLKINRAQEIEKQQKEYAKSLAARFGIENTQFSIYIPKIEARASVLENINPADEAAYTAALKEGVAHAAGTSVPGNRGGIFLFAHSTNAPWNVAAYNAVFYLLKELNPEDKDEVYVFYHERVYKYRVAEKHIVPANDISWITQAGSGPERIILQTCWPPGTTWKRLIIVAYRVEKEDNIS